MRIFKLCIITAFSNVTTLGKFTEYNCGNCFASALLTYSVLMLIRNQNAWTLRGYVTGAKCK